MDSIFNNADLTTDLGAEVGAEVVNGEETKDDAEKKAKRKAMKMALVETLQTTPDFDEKLNKFSSSVKVLNTLGYTKGSNVIVDKEATQAAGQRVLKPVSQIVGYKLQNVGKEAIQYITEVYQKDETGKFVGTTVKKTFAPGETICLARQYMTVFCAQPEISFTLANGKVVASSSSKKSKSLKAELASYHFTFDKLEDGTKPEVNDDEIKLTIDNEGVIKPEYEEVFGFLNNKKEKAERTKKNKYTAQVYAANYINKLLSDQGVSQN
jgi:hypothetical protein